MKAKESEYIYIYITASPNNICLRTTTRNSYAARWTPISANLLHDYHTLNLSLRLRSFSWSFMKAFSCASSTWIRWPPRWRQNCCNAVSNCVVLNVCQRFQVQIRLPLAVYWVEKHMLSFMIVDSSWHHIWRNTNDGTFSKQLLLVL